MQPLQSNLRQLALDTILLSEERKGGWYREKEEGESVVKREEEGKGRGHRKKRKKGKGEVEEED